MNLKTETEDLENKLQKKIIIATANPHKLEEINEINKYPNIEFEIIKGNFNPEENGSTYEENAFIKAKAAADLTKKYCLADDSGLCVDVLDGAPGLHSARYAGTQNEKIQKLLNELKSVEQEKRTAHFISVMVLVDEKGEIIHKTEGKVYGLISTEPKGTHGFGYDPIFFLPQYNKSMAELSSYEKNSLSHRAKALTSMLEWIDINLTHPKQ